MYTVNHKPNPGGGYDCATEILLRFQSQYPDIHGTPKHWYDIHMDLTQNWG